MAELAKTPAGPVPALQDAFALAPPPAGPVPVLQGTFALFLTPGDDLVIAYRASDSSEDRRLMIPGFVLQMATSASGLTPADMIAKIRSGDVDV